MNIMPNIHNFKWTVSETDKELYRKLCLEFVRNDESFSTFRKNNLYRSIIGAPSLFQAMQMYKKQMECSYIIENMIQFIKLDYVGSPYVYDFGGAFLSPNLIRYLDTIRLLHENFGDLDKQNIMEIGAGFGGLSYCIQTLWKCNYYLLDLSEAILLQKKVLNTLACDAITTACHDIDLLIAEYSLSELESKGQLYYYQNYISKAKKIFLRYNCTDKITHDMFIELLKKTHNITISQEITNAVSFNKLIIGSKI